MQSPKVVPLTSITLTPEKSDALSSPGSTPRPSQDDELGKAIEDIQELEAQVSRLKRELNFKDERIAQLETFIVRWTNDRPR